MRNTVPLLGLAVVCCAFLPVLLLLHQEFTGKYITNDVSEVTSKPAVHQTSPLQHSRNDNIRNCGIAVLLQQSVVDPHLQIARLQNIDKTWANWTYQGYKPQFFSFHPEYGGNTSRQIDVNFTNIHPLYPFCKQKAPCFRRESEYYFMQAILQVYWLTPSSIDYIVFANDHTFLIIPKLIDFLSFSTTPSVGDFIPLPGKDDLWVSGNHMISPSGVFFLSGAAGIILSRPVAALLAITWYQFFHGHNHMENLWKSYPATKEAQEMSKLCINQSSIVLPLAESQQYRFLITCRDRHTAVNSNNLISHDVNGRSKVFSVRLQRKGANSSWTYSLSFSKDWQLDSSCQGCAYYRDSGPAVSMAKCLTKCYNLHFFESRSTIGGYDNEDEVKKERRFITIAVKTSNTSINNNYNRSEKKLQQHQQFQTVQELSNGPDFHRRPNHWKPMSERFNAYGILRMIRYDYDSWYLKYKENTIVQDRRQIEPGLQYHYLARDLISFHYVEIKEANLLYQFLSHQRNITLAAIEEDWPRKPKEVGGYSGVLRSKQEAQLLYEVLLQLV